ncbi:FAD:protein FMN transferase [Streptomyces sp. NPDC127098]|uniref:FAD:protein FMN transferase n=1 Tax=Streptomyces sp. NPDC127098 TaxID=3347137 RepID=UPI003665B2A7
MGTVFSFDVRSPGTPPVRRALRDAVTWLHRVDAVFSTYREDSAVSRLARGETTLADCPPEVAEVLGLCAEVERRSGGWFSDTASGVLDPSGMVKGWAVERAAALVRAAGAADVYVNGGGDLQLLGEAGPGVPWRVGVAHPARPGELLAVLEGRDFAVATSGTAERGAHIVDPHRGTPVTELLSLTLVGDRLTPTDACATAAFAMGREARDWIEGLDGHEAIAVTRAGEVWQTSGFAAHGRSLA